MTTKEVLRTLLDRLPDDATFEDVQYQIYLLQKSHAGQEDVRQGRTVPHAQVMKELAQWLK
jgi:hypothetical protein